MTYTVQRKGREFTLPPTYSSALLYKNTLFINKYMLFDIKLDIIFAHHGILGLFI